MSPKEAAKATVKPGGQVNLLNFLKKNSFQFKTEKNLTKISLA